MLSDALISLSSTFIGLETDPEDVGFLSNFFFLNEAHSHYFRSRFVAYLRSQPQEVPAISKATIFLAAYLNLSLASLAYKHKFLLIGSSDDLALKFALLSNPNKYGYLFDRNFTSELNDHTSQVRCLARGEHIDLPEGEIQQVISTDSWQHEVLLNSGLVTKLTRKAVLTTLVGGDIFNRVRSGAAVRRLFEQNSAVRIDITDGKTLHQRILACATFTKKSS